MLVGSEYAASIGVFQPYYRTEFPGRYGNDLRNPQVATITVPEAAALIDSLRTIPTVVDGGIHGYLSLALSVVKDDSTHVFEAVIDTTVTAIALGKMMAVLTGNASAKNVLGVVGCHLGALPGPPMAEVTDDVTISMRGFRKRRDTENYVGRVRITNTSGATIIGPIVLVFWPGENITLTSASGTACAIEPSGAPYQVVSLSNLGPGQHADATLQFANPDEDAIDLRARRVYAGDGFR
jgi:hypothetical protein